MVGASLGAAFYITPLAFVDGTKSKMGGYGGALEVVEDGGRLLYTLASIPCASSASPHRHFADSLIQLFSSSAQRGAFGRFFLLMILLEFLITLVSKLPCEAGRYSLADTWLPLLSANGMAACRAALTRA
eukprot:3090934-Rhodomonas_salina.1